MRLAPGAAQVAGSAVQVARRIYVRRSGRRRLVHRRSRRSRDKSWWWGMWRLSFQGLLRESVSAEAAFTRRDSDLFSTVRAYLHRRGDLRYRSCSCCWGGRRAERCPPAGDEVDREDDEPEQQRPGNPLDRAACERTLAEVASLRV